MLFQTQIMLFICSVEFLKNHSWDFFAPFGAFYAKQIDLYHWKKNTGLEQHEGQ